MDAYPQGSLDHNVPFMIVSGLNSNSCELPLSDELRDQSILIRSELPALDSKEAQVLDEHFKEVDAKGHSWVGVERDEPFRCRIKSIGRVSLGRKAACGPKFTDLTCSPSSFHLDERVWITMTIARRARRQSCIRPSRR